MLANQLQALMKHSYVIIDDNQDSVLKTQAIAARFQNLRFVASANNYEDGLDLVLEHNPAIIFLEINPENTSSNLSLSLINELYRYLKAVPKIIITTADKEQAFDAIKYDVLDYCLKPLAASDLRKALLRFEMTLPEASPFVPAKTSAAEATPVIEATPLPETSAVADYPFIVDVPTEEPLEETAASDEMIDQPIINTMIVDAYEEMPMTELTNDEPPTVVESSKEDKPLIICVKSYGDYRFIEARDICYLQADNNSTDIHLYNGEMITAFKTLKHFETVLSSPFVRIHNSYIVNIDYVSRIHTGNSVCYIKNTTTKLPFSKSYKENVDAIINSITNGNYLEI
jgi:DNA-binding LytR/AlgR family response regulator